jgi:SAM-dependent methyltransferase
MAKFTYVLPGLKKLKKEMAQQTLQLLGDRKELQGSLEIGSAGGFINRLAKKIKLKGGRYVMNNVAPANTLAGMLERGSLFNSAKFLPLTYEPITPEEIPSESIGLVACYAGLHHCPKPLIAGFIASIHRVLRNGGLFILREHDVHTPLLETLLAFVHTVDNLGSNIPWAEHENQIANFMPVSAWSDMITAVGFKDMDARLLEKGDPTHNTLMMFVKE